MKIVLFLAILLLAQQVICEETPEAKADLVDRKFVREVGEEKWYSGYLGVGESDKYQLHYWFFETSGTAFNFPLLLWVNNGPGCSAMYEATHGNGPFVFNKLNSHTEFLNNFESWRGKTNILYIDAPQVGFSTGGEGEEFTDQIIVDLYSQALYKWYERFPDFRDVEVYLGGTGYAGVYVPMLAQDFVYTSKSKSQINKVNIKGIIIGNPAVTEDQIYVKAAEFPLEQFKYLANYGIISYQMLSDFQNTCGFEKKDELYKKDECKEIIKKVKFLTTGLNMKSINEPCLHQEVIHFDECTDDSQAIEWFNRDTTKTNIHVNADVEWKPCNRKINHRASQGSQYFFEPLIREGIRIWLYSGDQDAEITHISTVKDIVRLRQEMGLSDIVPYQAWFYADILIDSQKEEERIQQGGSYWKMDGLTYLRFKGCGQNVAGHNPIAAFEMYKSFIEGDDMETDYLAWEEEEQAKKNKSEKVKVKDDL